MIFAMFAVNLVKCFNYFDFQFIFSSLDKRHMTWIPFNHVDNDWTFTDKTKSRARQQRLKELVHPRFMLTAVVSPLMYHRNLLSPNDASTRVIKNLNTLTPHCLTVNLAALHNFQLSYQESTQNLLLRNFLQLWMEIHFYSTHSNT